MPTVVLPPRPDKPTKKARAWSSRAPEDRAKVYLSMRDHLNEVAALLGEGDGDAGEAKALRLAAMQFQTAASLIHRAKALRSTCCAIQLQFGACRCGA